jgi:molybdate/tungstate transport system substrate-binding protein
MLTYRSTRARFVVVGLAFIGLAAAGCSSSSSSSSSSAPSASASSAASSPAASASASSAPTGSGAVNVLYAGSLVNLITKQVGPAFQTASGYSVTGAGAGSTALVTDIKGKVYKGDVFISASPTATKTLVGSANGDWVSWYVSFASSNVVLGYNPKSKFASEIKSEPWYKAITTPGLKLGFTDPATDPKGKLVAEALSDTAKSKSLPALTTIENDKADVFPEETLVARLQAGQLDAAFFYTAGRRETEGHLHDLHPQGRAERAGRRGVRRLPARPVRPGRAQAGRVRPDQPAEGHRQRRARHRSVRAPLAAAADGKARPADRDR